jgi:hypothetical protein
MEPLGWCFVVVVVVVVIEECGLNRRLNEWMNGAAWLVFCSGSGSGSDRGIRVKLRIKWMDEWCRLVGVLVLCNGSGNDRRMWVK